MKAIPCMAIVLAILVLISYFIALPVFYGIFYFGEIESWQCYASQNYLNNVPWDMT